MKKVQALIPCNPHPDAPHGFSRNSSHSLGRYVCDCEGWTPDESPSIAIPFVSWSKEAEMRASWVANKPAPDCRTCRTCWHLHTSDYGDDQYECDSIEVCTNGDKYQPAPAVVLWRTE